MRRIFVFGSNLGGRHGKGAALYARDNYGAVYGEGVGRTGDAYAIPTKSRDFKVLPLSVIKEHVYDFIVYADSHPELTFELTRVGCGLAGYKDHQMAPLFKGVGSNVIVPKEWEEYL